MRVLCSFPVWRNAMGCDRVMEVSNGKVCVFQVQRNNSKRVKKKRKIQTSKQPHIHRITDS